MTDCHDEPMLFSNLGRRRVQADFAEKELKRQRDDRRKEAEAFVIECMQSGKVPPAIGHYGMVEFMEALQDVADITFAEGEQPINAFEWMKAFVEKMNGFQHLFGEIATKERVGKPRNEDEKLGEEIASYATNR